MCSSVSHITGNDRVKASEKYGIPPGGMWYWTQLPMITAMLLSNTKRPFALAFGKSGSPGYMYSWYDSMQDVHEALLKLPPGKRNGYELILADKPCRNYADIEFVGQRDEKHVKIRALKVHIRAYCKEKYRFDPELVVSCSTRLMSTVDAEDSLYKNSYHLVFQNQVFQTNHRGAMASFWADIGALLSGDEWHWQDNKGNAKRIIDFAVCTKNRVFRCLLCNKHDGVPFTRISADTLDEDDVFNTKYDENDPEAWESFAISNPVIDGDSNFVNDPVEVKSDSKPIGDKKNVRSSSAGSDQQSSSCAIKTLSDEELQVKLDTVAGLLVRIHPHQFCSYFDWMKVLFAVKYEMAAVGGHKVHNVLDAFSSIRAGYQGADDIASKYDQIKPRDDS